MRFLEALFLMKKGKKIRREHWCSCWYLETNRIWCDRYKDGRYCLSHCDHIDLMKLLEDVASDDWQYFDEQSEEWRSYMQVHRSPNVMVVVDNCVRCKRCGHSIFPSTGDLCADCWDEVCRK